jgi:hypothetical protein
MFKLSQDLIQSNIAFYQAQISQKDEGREQNNSANQEDISAFAMENQYAMYFQDKSQGYFIFK